MAELEPVRVKAQEHRIWTEAAPGWRKHDALMTRMTRVVSDRMLQAAGVSPGQRVLDVACGTGEPAIPAAERVGPTGHVVATDFAEAMLAVAREKAAGRGLRNVEFRQADGEELEQPPGSFDAVTIRWGIMFMPDAVACLRQVHRALREGGRIVVACWAGPEKNPWVSVSMAVLRRVLELPPPPAGATGIFAFADPARLSSALEAAGFRDIELEAVSLTMADFDSAAAHLAFMRDVAGPFAALYGQLPAGRRAEVDREIAAKVTGPDGRVALEGVTWVASGTR